MAEIVCYTRLVGGYKYMNCPHCDGVVEVDKPRKLSMPYCSDCGKIVLDATQVYCCWCGKRFEQY